MHACLRSSNNLFTLYQKGIESGFTPSADEIAEPRPAMIIIVTTFTVTQHLVLPRVAVCRKVDTTKPSLVKMCKAL